MIQLSDICQYKWILQIYVKVGAVLRRQKFRFTSSKSKADMAGVRYYTVTS